MRHKSTAKTMQPETDQRVPLLLAAFALVVALLGGSARFEMVQLVALRPLAGVFLAIALYYFSLSKAAEFKPLVAVLGLLVIWTAIQLVPLPPGIWHSLPGREAITDLDRATGLGQLWRPISFTPTRGFNALFSLAVPLAALLLAIMMNTRARALLQLIAALGLLDAMVGLLQVISGQGSPLYTYAITNDGAAVGLFANENHSAVFSAIALLIIARLGATSVTFREQAWLRLSYAPAFVLVLLGLIASGSRAGIAMGVLSLLISGVIFGLSLRKKEQSEGRVSKLEGWITSHPQALLGVSAAAVVFLIALFAFMGRLPGVDSVVSQDPFEDLRWRLIPVLTDMINTYWVFGTGFGSFDRLYMIYEPAELLMPSYVNQAHNDWAQLLIEGGAPAVLLLGALGIWIARAIWSIIRTARDGFAQMLFWGTIIVILAGASIVDYPLRTPIFQVAAIWLLVALAREKAKLPHIGEGKAR